MGDRYYFTAEVAKKILEGEEIVSLDLNLSKTIVKRQGNKFYLPNGEIVEEEDLKIIQKYPDRIFMYESGKFYELCIREEDKFYKLVPTSRAPTLEISGIRMHRTKDIDPWEDAKMKVSRISPRGTTLDTCMGLGYTAIWARRLGSRYVVTVEKDENVLFLAKLNPWSQEAFYDERIEIVKGDIFYLIRGFRKRSFDEIIHDPPRLGLAGELYSKDFYRHLFRILKPKGRLYHYVGNPGSRYRGKDIVKGVIKRLQEVGFKAFRDPDTLGVIAIKPKI